MNDERTKAAATAALNRYLMQHRLRRTPERYAILDKVFSLSEHFFVDTLHRMLDADGYHVSRATVYNTMEILVDAGLVRRHNFGSTPAQYEKVAGITNHHHLVCTQCGKVKEVKDAEIDRMLASKRYASFHPAYADLYIYGVCSRCARRPKPSSRTKE